MPDAIDVQFHLLRPLWLIALVPVAAIAALVLHRQRAEVRWSGVIAPHLLKHLIVKPQRAWTIPPVYLVATGLGNRKSTLDTSP